VGYSGFMLPARASLAIATTLAVAHHASRQRPVTTATLEGHYRLAPRKLEQTVRQLVRAGVICSVRGAGGGYYIDTPEAITLAMPVRAVLAEKTAAPALPPLDALVAPHLEAATQAMLSHLEQVTLRALLQDAELQKLFSLKAQALEYVI